MRVCSTCVECHRLLVYCSIDQRQIRRPCGLEVLPAAACMSSACPLDVTSAGVRIWVLPTKESAGLHLLLAFRHCTLLGQSQAQTRAQNGKRNAFDTLWFAESYSVKTRRYKYSSVPSFYTMTPFKPCQPDRHAVKGGRLQIQRCC
jgi:hypothetical protein